MKTYFVLRVGVGFSFPFCYVPSSASNTFLAQLLAVSLAPSLFSVAYKHQINLQVSRNRLAGQEGDRQTSFLNCTQLLEPETAVRASCFGIRMYISKEE